MPTSPHPSRIVDFAAFRAARAQLKLPLVTDEAAREPAPLQPGRSLSSHQIDHRTRMLRHLGRLS
jgi:hypothetical protein